MTAKQRRTSGRVRRTESRTEVTESRTEVKDHPMPLEESGPVEESGAAIPIDLDPAVSAGFIHGRFDLVLRGRAAAAAPIEEVALQVDGRLVSRVQFGDPGRAPEVMLPDGTPGRQGAFQLAFAQPGHAADGERNCTIVVRTTEGVARSAPFELAIASRDLNPVAVRYHPVASLDGDARPPVILYVERAAIDHRGLLTLLGWAVGSTRVITVQAFVDDARIGAAKTGLPRDDVGASYQQYEASGRSGFSLSTHLAAAEREASVLRVQAICLNGFSCEVFVPVERSEVPRQRAPHAAAPPAGAEPRPEPPAAFAAMATGQVYQLSAGFLIAPTALPTVGIAAPFPADRAPAQPAPLTNSKRDIHFYCDEADVAPDGTLRVLGWAVSGVGISDILVHLDGERLGEADIGFPRPDVGGEFSSIAMARHSGFRFEQHVPGIKPGRHTIRIVVRNGFDDTKEEAREIMVDLVARAASPRPAASADNSEFKFELDSPQVKDGVVSDPVTGRLTVEGWVLARSGVAGIEVFIDDQRLGEAHHGLARQDVGTAFPDWPDSLRSGYAFHCPPRALKDGTHAVQLVVRAKNGREHVVAFSLDVKKAEDSDELAKLRRRVFRAETDLIESLLRDLQSRPQFHLVIRRRDPGEADRLTLTLDSIRSQAYADWRATILADAEDADAVRGLVAAWDEDLAARIRVITPGEEAWDAGLAAGADLMCGVLSPGDELGADALAEVALAAGLHPGAQVIYGDELRISPASQAREPFFKPDWSPDLLLSTNYIGRPYFISGSVLQGIGATPRRLAADGEYHLLLRATEQAREIRHVAKLLAQRGAERLDEPAQEQAAITQALARRGTPGEALPGWGPGTWRPRRHGPVKGKVSIIIPTCAAKGYIETCLTTLRAHTAYRNFETVVVDNIPASETRWKTWLQQNADVVVNMPDSFNWSRFNNTAAAACDGEFLLFLNDDIEVVQDDWLDTMLEHMTRPEVAIVGPQLLYPDRKVQHAGMFLANNGIGRHAFRFAAEDEPGYFGLALTQRNVMAVTGACMLVRREVFERLGRFDELHTIVNNDLDFCLRAHKAGLLTVYTPHATLIHHELASRDKLQDVFDLSHFNAHWKTLFAAGDPYFSPRLFRHSDDVRPDDEPVQTVHSGHPLFRPEDIQRILVVKLDHIGDFVSALPAIRRLKQAFPHASITVLAGRASQAFLAYEPAIDELIPFDFFHARSQLGERELTKADYLALQEQLKPYRFDLAIDLRKHLSTRDVLKYTGARFLAGFDYMGQFPFLDIALEWDGDKTLQRKRAHVIDDLLALSEAVAMAASTDRAVIQPAVPRTPIEDLPEQVRHLFDRPVVAVHAGAGNITKQWPEEHVAALIDLMIERDDVNVMLVGGPDDEAVSESICANVIQPGRVVSMAGKTKLSALPQLLLACSLYIGNDSGPKHIAAALGVPTIGIHSGVVDAAEWGPMGARSVALRRNMSCSPCYLANAADCPRNLACLRQLEPAMVHETAQALLGKPVMSKKPASTGPVEASSAPVIPASMPDAERQRPSVAKSKSRARRAVSRVTA